MKKLFRAMLVHYNVMTGKRYWYQVRIIFIKNGRKYADKMSCIGLAERRSILDRRIVCKRGVADAFKDRQLHGCKLEYEIISYIGKIKL